MKGTIIFFVLTSAIIIFFGAWFILSDEPTEINEPQQEIIFINNVHGHNFHVNIYEDTKTGVQYLLFSHNGYHGISISPRYNPDGTLFVSGEAD